MSKHSASHSVSQTTALSLAASGTVCASTQSGRGSQNFAVVLGAFVRAFENGEIYLPGLKNALIDLRLSLENQDSSVVDSSFVDQLSNWKTASPENALLIPHIHLAVHAAVEVYTLKTQAEISAYRSKSTRTDHGLRMIDAQPAALLDGAPASFLRNTKNWGLFKEEATSTLCLAIRGTTTEGFECLVDMLVNVDAEAEEMVLFGIKEPFKAHKGFLESAKAMLAPICDALEKASSSVVSKPVLIFSGHSAGGGTALLLYHLLQSEKPKVVDRFSAIHCITFGSAAIASVPNPRHASRTQDHVVSFVNLGDPVPRADLAYASWIADTVGKHLAHNLAIKPLLPQLLFPGGELVLIDGEGEMMGMLDPDQLADIAFMDLEAHSSKTYERLVQQILPFGTQN